MAMPLTMEMAMAMAMAASVVMVTGSILRLICSSVMAAEASCPQVRWRCGGIRVFPCAFSRCDPLGSASYAEGATKI
ncbi:unnamed protein product [Urochloa humidicola]